MSNFLYVRTKTRNFLPIFLSEEAKEVETDLVEPAGSASNKIFGSLDLAPDLSDHESSRIVLN